MRFSQTYPELWDNYDETHLALFPVQVELVLADGHRPDTFCEGGGGREPRVHVNVSWSKGSPTHGHPVEKRVTRLLKV